MNRKRGIGVSLVASASLAVAMVLPANTAVAAPAAQPAPAAVAAAAADAVAAVGTGLAKGPDQAFDRVGFYPGGGGLFYSAYERSYHDLVVVGGDAVVVTDGLGNLRDTVTADTTPIALDTTAKLSPEAAAAIASKQLPTVNSVNQRLVVLAGATPALAYEVVLAGATAEHESNLHVFVDANTGAVLDSWDDVKAGTGNSFYNGNPVTITTQRNSATSFSMIDPTRPGVRCTNTSGTTFTGPDDNWGNGSGTSLETGCVDALYAAQRMWDMMRTWLGRTGVSTSGTGFPARVGLTQANAFWNGSSATFGRSSDGQRQVTPMDVVAHEFGHGVFQFTPGGSGGGGNEKGGLNESTGDIFGAITEAFANNPNDPADFQVGEEVNLVGNGPIRFMYQPSLRSGHPNCFSSAIPNTEVHAAAGPQNHWFYLVARGSNPAGGPASPTCNGTTVTGIGVQAAAQIFYNGLLRKVSAWTHARARVATLQAARALFPNGCTEFNTVRAAWSAVSVPAQAGEPTC
ncbi:MAG TPA: M4 family metallopeptidase [Actinophytocola sp.]|uniref:M4 family metallopeptidase n=1 Tax=Actinophytocola sp. TaxID=1872138 RepID=UPI002DBD4A20|nr:M4 family metallopeptidase [Actinophytocola sp.]HEU5472639.1 M4 family metallopeptidase [Actinophytocola sp.]